jgi:hypothetical protein
MPLYDTLVDSQRYKNACTVQPCRLYCHCRRHLAFLATSIGQLQDAEQGSTSSEDMPDQHTALETDPEGPSSNPTPAVIDQEQQQEQQQAVSEVCRLLIPELCTQVQHCGSLMDATTLANFVAAMGRLGHYDWQTMRLVGTLATRQAHVRCRCLWLRRTCYRLLLAHQPYGSL